LMDRLGFKNFSTRMIIAGLVPSSLALVLASQLVVSQVFGGIQSLVVSGFVATIIAVFWWILPIAQKFKGPGGKEGDKE
ncbi:MAG TPA: hypothetical protein VM409_05880, partial [Chloroflexia bacterium]|nr:hypothetical protein [Chloroflexia bacterium]